MCCMFSYAALVCNTHILNLCAVYVPLCVDSMCSQHTLILCASMCWLHVCCTQDLILCAGIVCSTQFLHTR